MANRDRLPSFRRIRRGFLVAGQSRLDAFSVAKSRMTARDDELIVANTGTNLLPLRCNYAGCDRKNADDRVADRKHLGRSGSIVDSIKRYRQSIAALAKAQPYIRVHARNENQAGIGDVHFRVHGSRCFLNFIREPCDMSGEGAVQRRDGDVYRFADMNARNGGFGYRQNEAKQIVLREPDDRHRLRLRSRSGLNHGPGVGVALRYYSRERSGDDGVFLKGAEARLIGFRHGRLTLSGLQSGLSRGNFGFGNEVL